MCRLIIGGRRVPSRHMGGKKASGMVVRVYSIVRELGVAF